MQIPFVGFQPIRTSEHMASAGQLVNMLFIKYRIIKYCDAHSVLHVVTILIYYYGYYFYL